MVIREPLEQSSLVGKRLLRTGLFVAAALLTACSSGRVVEHHRGCVAGESLTPRAGTGNLENLEHRMVLELGERKARVEWVTRGEQALKMNNIYSPGDEILLSLRVDISRVPFLNNMEGATQASVNRLEQMRKVRVFAIDNMNDDEPLGASIKMLEKGRCTTLSRARAAR